MYVVRSLIMRARMDKKRYNNLASLGLGIINEVEERGFKCEYHETGRGRLARKRG